LSQNATFGIVGGYGATGRIVASLLSKSSGADLLVGGRDLARASAFAAQLGPQASAARLDVLDEQSLGVFCSRCSIIINCGGPVMLLEDRVAQAAFRARRHYVDAASMGFVRERMLPRGRELTDLNLCCVVSAGWMPGLTEFLPAYAHAQAEARMAAIDSVTVYFADGGDWSKNALRDGVGFLRHTGLRRAGYFHKGCPVRAGMSAAMTSADLGAPIGRGRFALYSMPELDELGRRLTGCDFFSYSYVSGLRSAFAAILLAAVPLPEALAVRLLRNVFRRNRFPVGGFVVVRVVGSARGRRTAFNTQIVFDKGQDYWLTAVPLAVVARMIAANSGVRAGVHYLADAVEPGRFMAELRSAGVQQTEAFEPLD